MESKRKNRTVLVTVLSMREINTDVAQNGREDAQTIPIIALTANAFNEDVQRSMQDGLNAHLSKPVEPNALFDTLEKMIWP